MTSSPPLIGTSFVANDRMDVQQQSVTSWLDQGFDVVSFNSPEEIENLKFKFPGVTFAPQMRTAMNIIGKPMIFINDMLHYFSKHGPEICGIVNSDIYFRPEHDIIGFIYQISKDAFLYGPRLEVENFNSIDGTLDPFGFDYFFFDKSIKGTWLETKFCLGMPFWDHWFPLMPILAGKNVFKLMTPVANHIPHPTSRDDSFFMFNDEFAQIVLASIPKNSFPDDLKPEDYFVYKKNAIELESRAANEKERLATFETLALFLDALTKFVILYLDNNSDKIHIQD